MKRKKRKARKPKPSVRCKVDTIGDGWLLHISDTLFGMTYIDAKDIHYFLTRYIAWSKEQRKK